MYEYLKTEHWRRLRHKLIYQERGSCPCGYANTRHLELHHRTYQRAGHERESDVIVVCHECHKEITRYEKATGKRASDLDLIRRICGRRASGEGPPEPKRAGKPDMEAALKATVAHHKRLARMRGQRYIRQ